MPINYYAVVTLINLAAYQSFKAGLKTGVSWVLILKLGVSWVLKIQQREGHITGLRVSSKEFLF